MDFSGNNYRSIMEQNNFSFDAFVSIDNLTGSARLGFSGETTELNFDFESGKVFDPEGRYVYSYRADVPINVSGVASGTDYNYYINGKPICFIGQKSSFKIQNTVFNTTGCTMDADLKVFGETKPSITSGFSGQFFTSGILSGQIANNTSFGIEIFSGNVKSPTNMFEVLAIPTGLITTNSGEILIRQTGTTNDKSHDIELDLYTNFGKTGIGFSTVEISTGSFTGFAEISTSLTDTFSGTGAVLVDPLIKTNFYYDISYITYDTNDSQIFGENLTTSLQHLSGGYGTSDWQTYWALKTGLNTLSLHDFETSGYTQGADPLKMAHTATLGPNKANFVAVVENLSYTGGGVLPAVNLIISGINNTSTTVVLTGATGVL